jgi:RHS repeat-associated protein
VSTYSYDALNRVSGVTFSDTTPTITYLYDDITAGNFGKGRLTKITDGTGNTTYKYDILGRLIQKTQTTGTVVKTIGYGYDALGRMSSITYPSGKVLTYTFDVQGRVASMAVNAVNLVSGITYQPFGPAKSWTWSGGPVQTRNFDLDGRQTSYPYTATGTVNLAYDLGNRITALSGTVAKTYAYDKLDRLTGYGTAITYQYDANGNRSQFKNGTAISTYNNQTTSNRLTSITGTGPEAYSYDLAGNTTAIAAKALIYDARGRLTTHTSGTTVTSFGINAIGQRLVKAGATAALTTRFVYGEDGKLLGEYDNAGALITEHVYLQDTPIAAIKTAGAYVVQADHLNTPRAILGAGNVSAWTWDSDAFGTTLANEKPSTLATFNYNLRFPGQYYDKETGLHQNYFRDYNPKIGKYVESDPIGLAGGINTYAYARENPILWTDSLGLDVSICSQSAFGWMPVDHQWIKTDTVEAGMGPVKSNCGDAGNALGDLPGDPVQVCDHSGRSKQEGATCKKVEGRIDETAVNEELTIGRKLGSWGSTNQCQSFVKQVISTGQRTSRGTIRK